MSQSEAVHLLSASRSKVMYSHKTFKVGVCISNKATYVILVWHFAILLGYKLICNFDSYVQIEINSAITYIAIIIFSTIAIFSPVIGILADIKLTRYRTVLCSSYFILVQIVVVLMAGVAAIIIFVPKPDIKVSPIAQIAAAILVGITAIPCIVFLINGFHFAMDQLLNSSTNELIKFIHWYVWANYVCILTTEIAWNLSFYGSIYYKNYDFMHILGISMIVLTLLIVILLLVISLCIATKRKVWFLLEPPSINPYTLLTRVIKFAYKHKVPLRRSAFTYCEDESPSRLDLAKQKYGGPFTTRQVEDVKAFLGILKVLLTAAPAFYLQIVTQTLLPSFARHNNVFISLSQQDHKREIYIEGTTRHIMISNGLLTPCLVVFIIPFYMSLIRPRILYHVPKSIKRIGIALFLLILSLLCSFGMDYTVHKKKTEFDHCMLHEGYREANITTFIYLNDTLPSPLMFQSLYFFIPQHILSALANILLEIAVLEFICSQSPYSMKGLVLGVCFSLRNLFQIFAVIVIIPFGVFWKESYPLSCGSGFYLTNVLLAMLALSLFMYVARRYRHRIMDEPSNEYRYAEEYYSYPD